MGGEKKKWKQLDISGENQTKSKWNKIQQNTQKPANNNQAVALLIPVRTLQK